MMKNPAGLDGGADRGTIVETKERRTRSPERRQTDEGKKYCESMGYAREMDADVGGGMPAVYDEWTDRAGGDADRNL